MPPSGSKNKNGYKGYDERWAGHLKTMRAKRVALVRAAKDKPCTDCGVPYPYWVMQLDHCRGEKLFQFTIRTIERTSLEKLATEIEKCDPVCANCHADRTYRQGVLQRAATL